VKKDSKNNDGSQDEEMKDEDHQGADNSDDELIKVKDEVKSQHGAPDVDAQMKSESNNGKEEIDFNLVDSVTGGITLTPVFSLKSKKFILDEHSKVSPCA
jgi:hypothetical protein